MKAKVALVRGAREVYGLAAALRVVGLARSTWYYHTGIRVSYAERYAHLEAPLKAIAEAHPEYGYRRATTELRGLRRTCYPDTTRRRSGRWRSSTRTSLNSASLAASGRHG